MENYGLYWKSNVRLFAIAVRIFDDMAGGYMIGYNGRFLVCVGYIKIGTCPLPLGQKATIYNSGPPQDSSLFSEKPIDLP
jgi:hypothetical protein